MKAIRYIFFALLMSPFLMSFSCSDDDDSDDGDSSEINTVTFLDVTKEVIGGCTVQTFDGELGTLCTFTVLYEIEGATVTISAVVPGSCNQELNDVFQISDNFIGDNIRFGVSVIRFDATDPDNYFGQFGTVTVVKNDSETSFSFDGVVYNIFASTLTETIVGSAVCPL